MLIVAVIVAANTATAVLDRQPGAGARNPHAAREAAPAATAPATTQPATVAAAPGHAAVPAAWFTAPATLAPICATEAPLPESDDEPEPEDPNTPVVLISGDRVIVQMQGRSAEIPGYHTC